MDTRTDEQVLGDHMEDEFIKYSDHIACWDFQKRGGVGETVLHLCYLMDTHAHLEVAKILLSMYPTLALDVYEGEEYFGKSELTFLS